MGTERTEKMTADQVVAAGFAGWSLLVGSLRARFGTGTFAAGMAFVAEVGSAAEELDHHPDVTLRYPSVDIVLRSHDVNGITARDVDLARRINHIAERLGVAVDPQPPTVVEIALDTPDLSAVGPFWAAVLTGHADALAGDEVVDTAGRIPGLWFQRSDARDPADRQRFHLDVWVPLEVAPTRIAAALAAGGRLVDDSQAPSYVVLADADGNKACVCTSASPAPSSPGHS